MAKSRNPDALKGLSRTVDNGDTLIEAQWYKANTVYQILEVRPPIPEKKGEEETIITSIVAKERGSGCETIQPNSFDEYSLDRKSIEKLQNYPKKGNGKNISSYLPSSGVTFSEGFFKALSTLETQEVKQTEVNNFYQPMRTLLYSRKISQLIAKTWWAYLEAQKTDLWDKFIAGAWNKIDSDILDGLIAREIFLYGGSDAPDEIDNEDIYLPLKPRETPVEQARFLILPTSKGWQGVSLSLLLAGQAYYKIGNEYHQISQPIFSTGETTILHSLEVDWGKFQGDIKEIIISQERPWVGYHIVIPYPPIPFNADAKNIRKWAWAKEEFSEQDPEEERHFPFYKKDDQGEYLIDVEYFKPPYSYIPLSCS